MQVTASDPIGGRILSFKQGAVSNITRFIYPVEKCTILLLRMFQFVHGMQTLEFFTGSSV
jgi:hypothetical protein